jgi:hypothetical protein
MSGKTGYKKGFFIKTPQKRQKKEPYTNPG